MMKFILFLQSKNFFSYKLAAVYFILGYIFFISFYLNYATEFYGIPSTVLAAVFFILTFFNIILDKDFDKEIEDEVLFNDDTEEHF